MATRLYTQQRGGGDPIEELPAEIISYGYRMNRPGSIGFGLALDQEKTTVANVDTSIHEVVVERDGTVVWVGPVLTLDEDDTPRTVGIGGEGLMTHLRKMHVTSTLSFSASVDDQFDIARALIDHHQDKAGGNFGIDTTAVSTSGRTRDRTYNGDEHKNVDESIVEMSELDDGYDFDFNPATLPFDHYYPLRGQRRTDIVFDGRNIRAFRRRRDATSQASQIIGVGAGEEENMLIRTLQSSTGVAVHGLTQRIITHKDVTVSQTLEDHVADALTAFAGIPNLIALTVGTRDPQLFTYGLGDEVKVDWPSPYDPVNEYQRLIGFDVIWESGEESAVLFLEPL